jgi:hypothetical protein
MCYLEGCGGTFRQGILITELIEKKNLSKLFVSMISIIKLLEDFINPALEFLTKKVIEKFKSLFPFADYLHFDFSYLKYESVSRFHFAEIYNRHFVFCDFPTLLKNVNLLKTYIHMKNQTIQKSPLPP